MAITKGYKKSLSRLFPIFKWLIPAFALAAPLAVQAQTLSKVFTPNTIGPGSVSTATFTITNTSDEAFPISGLAFTDVLPAAPGNVYIASPANASTDCVDGVVSAPAGGGTISFSNGKLGAFQFCTVTVDVTASTAGVHTNPAVTLTYNELAGDPPMSLPVDLTVDSALPGFSKSFAPSSVSLGGRSTLTFTIDNSANGSNVLNLDFSDHLPLGMVIADPANAGTTCGTAIIPPTLTATAGTDTITLDANGTGGFPAVAAEATCTVTVDIIATGIGELLNISGELLASFVSAGKASDTLDVTVTPLALRKSFINDPVPPGGSVSLEFTIDNFDRVDSATAVGFTDDLTTLVPALAGLTFSSLLSNNCGGNVSGVGSTTISFSGGTVAAGSSCSIVVDLAVPPAATPGTYTNTTSTVSGTVGGAPVVGNMASDDLYVEPVPLLTKEFLEEGTLAPDPVVNAGDDVVLRFTVTNTSTTSAATDVTFDDELTDGSSSFPPDMTSGFLPFPVTVTLPPDPDPPCGAGSSLALVSAGQDRQALRLTSGSLDPAGTAEDSCTFDVIVNIPAGMGPGTYLNTTEEISATVDGATRIGAPASDTLEITSAPRLTKVFSDDPVAPGGTVTLEFTLTYPADASSDAIDIAFTDDLTGFVPPLAGLVANGLPLTDACDGDGPGGNPGSGTLSESGGVLTFTSGILSPGESCTFSTTLGVPAGTAAGAYTNTTSSVSAMVAGLAVTSPPASDNLDVAGLTFTKEFLGDPALPGETLTLRFTIDNIHPTLDATTTSFTDNLAANLPGLAATGLLTDTCGGTLSGTTFLVYTGGSVTSGSSCTIEVDVLIPAGAADGDYRNTTSSLTATQGSPIIIDPATDVLTVNSTLLQLTKEFTDDPVTPGSVATLEFTLTNLDATQAISAVAFTDDLGAALAGLTFDSVLLNNCGGTVSGTGTDMIDVSGASLAAAATCEIRVEVSIPGGAVDGIYPNTTSEITGTMGGFPVSGSPASDDLQVVQLLTFSKSFDGPTTATGTSVLSFTITNPGPDTASSIAFIDDLNSVIPGLVATSLPALPCGAGSAITGVSQLNFTGGELAANGGSCSFDVELQIPATAVAGTFPNTTSDLLQGGLKVADPATADLVIEPPPTFAKLFATSTLGLGQTTALTFTIDNSASAVTASALSFIDNLPAGTEVANPPGASNSCGGTFSAAAGTTAITLSGGVVGTGTTCNASVNIVAVAVGTQLNTTGDLTSSSGNSGTASDTLLVLPNPGFGKTFALNPIIQGQSSTLTFTIDNSGSSVAATGLDFTDILPADMVVATPANASTNCSGGTLTAAAGSGSISYAGGSVAASSSCTITVDTSATTVGDLVNTSGDLTSSLGDSGTASDTLTVNGAPVPGFGKVFAPNPVIQGQSSTLTFTIDNTGGLVAATALNFTDTLPAGMVVATPANASTTCSGGTLSGGSGSISYAGGSVAASSSCTVTVDTLANAAGSLANTSGDLTSSLGNSGTASDTLTVNGAPVPGFAKVFAPNPVIQGQSSTLTFTIDNTGGLVAATALNFTDTLPAGMVVATPANASTTCTGGVLTATAGTGSISYAGGSVTASSSCTVTVDTLANSAGSLANTSGDLTSSLGNSGTASDTLTVNGAPVPGFAKVFAPNPVIQGQSSTLTFTIDNTGGLVVATALNFTDTLPAGMVVATPANASTTCTGGVLTATAGTGSISYAGGSVTASSSCTVTVDTLANSAGSLVNTSGDLTSSLGNSGTASDTLTVNGAPVPGFGKVFTPNPIALGQSSTLTFTIDNTGGLVAATALNFTDTLPAGMVVATPANASTTCTGGALTATAGTGSISYAGGSVAASSSCTVTVDTLANAAGSLANTSGDLTSSLGNSGTASDTLEVNVLPTFQKAFDSTETTLGAPLGLTFTIDNSASPLDATNVSFTDNLPAGMLVDNPGNPVSTCIGGVLSAPDDGNVVSYTGGSVPAGTTCTIKVTVVVTVAGTLVNTTEDLTSSLGNSGSTQASITIYDLTPKDIPTLSQWALVLLGMGILLLVVSQQRRHRPGQGS